jgi:hypothetical protein
MRNSFRTPGHLLITDPIGPVDGHPIAAGLEYLMDEPHNIQGRAIDPPGPNLRDNQASQVDGFPVNLVGAGAKLEQI